MPPYKNIGTNILSPVGEAFTNTIMKM